MSANLASILTDTAERHGDRIAVKLDDLELNYALLDEASARVAGAAEGAAACSPATASGSCCPNVPYFPVAYYGVLRAGGVVVPMNVLLKGREVAFYLDGLRARSCCSPGTSFARGRRRAAPRRPGAECIVVKPGEFEQLRRPPSRTATSAERADDDTAVILYTSGTTGHAEGRRAHARQPAQQRASLDRRSFDFDRGRRRPRRAAAVPLLRADVRR